MNSLHTLDALEADWQRLTPEGTAPFQTFGWNRAWFRHYHRDYDGISVFVFFSSGCITAIVPCYRRRNELRLAGDWTCDFQDLIVENRQDGPEILRQIFRYARRRHLRLRFDMLSSRGILWPSIEKTADSAGYLYYSKTVGPCPWFRLPDSAEAFLRSLPHGRRKQVRRAMRRLDQALPGHRFAYRKGSELSPADFREIGELHQRNQFRKCGRSGFEDPVYRNFLNETAESPEAGMRLCELRDGNGDLIAFDLGFASGDRFYAYVGAWDTPHAHCSPGVCLLFRQVADLPRNGIQFYDFLRGDEEYKFNYATETYAIHKVKLYPRTPANRARLRLLRLIDRAKQLAKPYYHGFCRTVQKAKIALHRRTPQF